MHRATLRPVQAEPSDESLFEAYRAGDSAAFRAIFNRYAPRLRGMLRRGLPSDIDADDLLQQVFLQLHRARADFDADRPLRPWLWTVALNVKRQRLRRLKLERAYMRPLPEDAPVGTVPAHDPIRAENARRVRAALARTRRSGKRSSCTGSSVSRFQRSPRWSARRSPP